MPWYIFGTLFVVPTFAGFFAYPEFVNKKNEMGEVENKTLQTAWYISLPGLFNIGWASV